MLLLLTGSLVRAIGEGDPIERGRGLIRPIVGPWTSVGFMISTLTASESRSRHSHHRHRHNRRYRQHQNEALHAQPPLLVK